MLQLPTKPLAVLLCSLATLTGAGPSQASHAQENALVGHPSPYLALHGRDPVHWRTWGNQAVEAARREGKLIYVSVGYFSCHWCHVMQRESYQNAEIARALNRSFIPVKVDRELRPALDAHLMAFVRATRGIGGWPLNVFLTPEGHPLVGSVYLPPDHFKALLERLDGHWSRDKDRLADVASQVGRLLYGQAGQGPRRQMTARVVQRARWEFVNQAMGIADRSGGGFGRAAKFPSVPQLNGLMAIYAESRDQGVGEFLTLTMSRMATGGLRDQLGGGFFRYATDPDWRVPHFEKMLYDNALLAKLYLDASVVLGQGDLAGVAGDTLDFMIRELWNEEGGFAASLSSLDGEDVEGGFYLWDEDTLSRVLTREELTAASLAWGFAGAAPHENGHLPVDSMAADQVAERLNLLPAQVLRLLDSARRRLLTERRRRSVPKDVKRLAGWNGLALSALARATELGLDRYLEVGRRLRAYLSGTLWDGRRLMRALNNGAAVGNASLQDYAYVARGLLDWARATGSSEDLSTIRAVVELAWEQHFEEGRWRLAAEFLIPYGPGEPVIVDGPMPSPSAVLLEATLGLAEVEADLGLRGRAEKALKIYADGVVAEPFFNATQIRVLSRFFLNGRPTG